MPTRRVNAFHDYGVGKGEGADDGALMTQLVRDYPQGARVDLSQCWAMNLKSTWTVGAGCEDLVFDWDRDPRQGSAQRVPATATAPETNVAQAMEWHGTPGGFMVDVRESSYVRFKGPAVTTLTAGRAFTFDKSDAHISSQSALSYALIEVTDPRNTVPVVFSETATGNVDFMGLEHVTMRASGGGCGAAFYALTTRAKSAFVRGAAVKNLAPGMRVRGYDVGPNGGAFESVVAEVDVPKAIARLAHETSVSRSSARFIFGEGLGRAVVCGPNANAHKTRFVDVNLTGFATGLDVQNGGIILERMQYTDCELCESITNLSQPARASDTRFEFCRQFLVYRAAMPYKLSNIALDLEHCAPGHDVIENYGGGVIELDGFVFENGLPHASTHVWRIEQGQRTSLRLGRVGGPWLTLAALGMTSHTPAHLFLVAPVLPDLPGGMLTGYPDVVGANPPVAPAGDVFGDQLGNGQMAWTWDDVTQTAVLVVKRDNGELVQLAVTGQPWRAQA